MAVAASWAAARERAAAARVVVAVMAKTRAAVGRALEALG